MDALHGVKVGDKLLCDYGIRGEKQKLRTVTRVTPKYAVVHLRFVNKDGTVYNEYDQYYSIRTGRLRGDIGWHIHYAQLQRVSDST